MLNRSPPAKKIGIKSRRRRREKSVFAARNRALSTLKHGHHVGWSKHQTVKYHAFQSVEIDAVGAIGKQDIFVQSLRGHGYWMLVT